jgi:hypothetical protein
MTQHRTPSTIAWIITHLGYPLLPVVLEAGIRLITLHWEINLETMNSATLAMSVGLVALFVNQSIRADTGALADEAEQGARNGTCTFFTSAGIFFFVLFGVIVLLQALVVDKKLDGLRDVLQAFQITVFLSATAPLFAAIAAQRTYKLRAELV